MRPGEDESFHIRGSTQTGPADHSAGPVMLCMLCRMPERAHARSDILYFQLQLRGILKIRVWVTCLFRQFICGCICHPRLRSSAVCCSRPAVFPGSPISSFCLSSAFLRSRCRLRRPLRLPPERPTVPCWRRPRSLRRGAVSSFLWL